LPYGVVINVELVQSEESVSSAQLDYINSVFAHNIAMVSLANALGWAADNLPQFLNMQLKQRRWKRDPQQEQESPPRCQSEAV
jgi:hypothetical protein